MMANERNALKAGLFILASIALAVALIVGISGLERLTEPRQFRAVTFTLVDDLGGLNVGDDVRIGGYRVGVVRRIDVIQTSNPDQAPHIRVIFSLPERYTLRQGARLSIQGTLTGTSWLNFDDLGTGATLPDDAPLRGSPGAMAVLTGNLTALMPQVQAIVADLRTRTLPAATDTIQRFGKTADTTDTLVADLHKNLPMILERYRTVADRGAEMMVQVRDLIGDTKGDFRGTMSNLNSATGELKQKLPALLEQVDATLANAKGLSESARLLIASNRGRIDAMVRALKTTGDNLQGASAEIRRSPWRLLYKPAPGEIANLNLFDAARAFADGARALDDATQSLQAALADPNSNPRQIEELMDELRIKVEAYRQVEQKLWQSVKE